MALRPDKDKMAFDPATQEELNAVNAEFGEKVPEINIEKYKNTVTGDDWTAAFTAASVEAASLKVPLRLKDGKTYKLKHTTAISLGMSAILGNDVTIDVSESTAYPSFKVEGTRTLVKSGLQLSKGGNTISSVATGSNFKRGDMAMIISNQPLPTQNLPTRPYFQGELHVVDNYDSSTGALLLSSEFEFDYSTAGFSGAYLYRVEGKKFSIPNGVTFVGAGNGNQKCLDISYSIFDLDCTFKGFGEASVKTQASIGTFSGKIFSGWKDNSSTSYGIQINDLSDVSVVGAKIYATKHTVSGGGGGYFKLDDFGGTGAAIYPSRYSITGGTYVNTNNNTNTGNEYPAIDAHGNVKDITITGAIVHGGIKVNADNNVVTGNIIYFKDSNAYLLAVDEAFYTSNWGSHIFSDNLLVGLGTLTNPVTASAISVRGNYRSVKIKDNKVTADFGATLPVSIYGGEILTLDFEGNDFIDCTGTNFINIEPKRDVRIKNNKFNALMLSVKAVAAGVSVFLEGNTMKNSYQRGFYINGVSFEFEEVHLTNNLVEDSQWSGVYIYKSKKVFAINNKLRNNGKDTAASTTSRVGLEVRIVAELVLDHNDFRVTSGTATQVSGIYHVIHDTLPTEVYWTDNTVKGVTSTPGYTLAGTIKRQRGNKANSVVPDYIEGTNGNLYKFDGTAFILVP